MEKISTFDEEKLFALLDELIEGQQKQLIRISERIIPSLTSDDLLQPNDFPELEFNPLFRYEEGVLAGMMTMRMSLLAALKSQ